MVLNILDAIFLILTLVIAVVAAFKGFIKEVLGKAAWILAMLCSVWFYQKLAVQFQATIKNQTVRNAIAFVLIFMLVFLVVKIIEVILSKIFSGEIVGGLNRALGFLLGIVEGLVLSFFILFLMTAQPWINVEDVTKGSLFLKVYQSQHIEQVLNPDSGAA